MNKSLEVNQIRVKVETMHKSNFEDKEMFSIKSFYRYFSFCRSVEQFIFNVPENDRIKLLLFYLPEEEKNNDFYILNPHKSYSFLMKRAVATNGVKTSIKETNTNFDFDYIKNSLVYSAQTGFIYTVFDPRIVILYRENLIENEFVVEEKDHFERCLIEFYPRYIYDLENSISKDKLLFVEKRKELLLLVLKHILKENLSSLENFKLKMVTKTFLVNKIKIHIEKNILSTQFVGERLFKPEDFFSIFFKYWEDKFTPEVSEEDKMQFWLLFLPEEEKNSTFYILNKGTRYIFVKNVYEGIKNNDQEIDWNENFFEGNVVRSSFEHTNFFLNQYGDKIYIEEIFVYSATTGYIYNFFNPMRKIELFTIKVEIGYEIDLVNNRENNKIEKLKSFYLDSRPEFKRYDYIISKAEYSRENIIEKEEKIIKEYKEDDNIRFKQIELNYKNKLKIYKDILIQNEEDLKKEKQKHRQEALRLFERRKDLYIDKIKLISWVSIPTIVVFSIMTILIRMALIKKKII